MSVTLVDLFQINIRYDNKLFIYLLRHEISLAREKSVSHTNLNTAEPPLIVSNIIIYFDVTKTLSSNNMCYW